MPATLRPALRRDAELGEPSADRAFLWLASIFGALLLIVSPPLRWGDENVHLLQAYAVSEGALQRESVNDQRGVRLPRGIRRLILHFSLRQHSAPQGIVGWRATWDALSIPLYANQRVFQPVGRLPYSPLAYLPQATGIALARWLGDSALLVLFAARTANLAAWIGLTWAAVRVAPELRWPLCMLALAPMNLFLAAHCSADAFTNGLAFLWTAVILRLASDRSRSIDARMVAILCLLAGLLSLAKLLYGVLVLLILVIPAERFGGPLRRLGVAGLVAVIAAMVVGVWLVWAGEGASYGIAIEGANTRDSHLRALAAHPFASLGIVARTIAPRAGGWIQSLADTKWGDPPGAALTFWAWAAAVVTTIIADPPRVLRVTIRMRLLALGIVVATLGAIILLAFVLWSPIGADQARGVQGRYLIPLLPAALLALAPASSALRSRTRIRALWTAAVLTSVALGLTCVRGLELNGLP